MTAARDRIAALDLIRGIAVLGIVAINVTSFAGGSAVLFNPDLPQPGSPTDHATWQALFVLFEGKMRALFSLLFGASLMLFIARADAASGDGERRQVHRLGWLALIGYLHYLLLWDGDILFLYALAGLVALLLRHASPLALAASALFLCTIWQGWGLAQWHGAIEREAAVAAGTASPRAVETHRQILTNYRGADQAELARISGSGTALIAHKAFEDPLRPLRIAAFSLGETFSLVLLGMALFQSGFFSGGWSRRQLCWLAVLGIGGGGAATIGFAQWAAGHAYPEVLMRFAISYGLTFPHFAMALGYAAALMLGSAALARSALGTGLIAAGRMALSNYLGTSVVLCALCYGWGGRLAGQLSLTAQAGLAALVMVLMLVASRLWLARFAQGPFERLWRSLSRWSQVTWSRTGS